VTISRSATSIRDDLKRSADAARQTADESSDLKTVILELGETIRQFRFDHYQSQRPEHPGQANARIAPRAAMAPAKLIPPVPQDEFLETAYPRMARAGGAS
jgi:hypothetical protein